MTVVSRNSMPGLAVLRNSNGSSVPARTNASMQSSLLILCAMFRISVLVSGKNRLFSSYTGLPNRFSLDGGIGRFIVRRLRQARSTVNQIVRRMGHKFTVSRTALSDLRDDKTPLERGRGRKGWLHFKFTGLPQWPSYEEPTGRMDYSVNEETGEPDYYEETELVFQAKTVSSVEISVTDVFKQWHPGTKAYNWTDYRSCRSPGFPKLALKKAGKFGGVVPNANPSSHRWFRADKRANRMQTDLRRNGVSSTGGNLSNG
jgi:hypothetical protein